MRVTGVRDPHLRLREAGINDGECELLVYSAPCGVCVLEVTLDGEHVRYSPATLEVAAGGAAPGRCYAFGACLEAPVPMGATAQLTIVACDSAGARRSAGGDPFRVIVTPHLHAHHPAQDSTSIQDLGTGSHLVSWVPPMSGTFAINVTLGSVHIWGSPFRVVVVSSRHQLPAGVTGVSVSAGGGESRG